jgi:hypothetical protein
LYNLIDQSEADRIKEILELNWLYKDIEMEVDNLILKVSSVGGADDTEHHKEYLMKEFYLLDNDGERGVLEYKDKRYDIFVNIGEWSYETRLKNTHITLGSSKFNVSCFQIELSESIKDEKYIYIIKNVSNMAGREAISRLYRGLKGNRDEKLKRQELFIEKYESEIIRQQNKDWIVISKIKIDDLYDITKADIIFYDLLQNMVLAMLLVESIGEKTAI